MLKQEDIAVYGRDNATALSFFVENFIKSLGGVTPARVKSTAGNRCVVELMVGQSLTLWDIPVYQCSVGEAQIWLPVKPGDIGYVIVTAQHQGNFIDSLKPAEPKTSEPYPIDSSFFLPVASIDTTKSAPVSDALCVTFGTEYIAVTQNSISIVAQNVVVEAKQAEITADTINATGKEVNIDGDAIKLAGGGPAIARVGDPVSTPAGMGTIQKGSDKVQCG